MNERYLVLFEGEVQSGEAVRDVRRRLIEEFALSEERMERLFSGQPMVVFKSNSREKSKEFSHRFAKTGALCHMEVESETGEKIPACKTCGAILESKDALCPRCDPAPAKKEPAPKHPETDQESGFKETVDAFWESATSTAEEMLEDEEKSQEPPQKLEGLPELWQAFAGPRGPWYSQRFALFARGDGIRFVPTWNWGAFFFGVIWLIYRKMYGFAAVSFFMAAAFAKLPGGVLLLAFLFGFCANFLYFIHVRLKVDAIISASTKVNPQHAMDTLGGVNPLAKVAIIFMVLLSVMAILGPVFMDIEPVIPK